MKKLITKQCENCKSLKPMRENVAYFWDETKHFCTFHQKFVDNSGYCKK